MRVLLIDHGCCDLPNTRVHAFRHLLARRGAVAMACGPTSVSSLESDKPGLQGIHLHDIAAANMLFLEAVRNGSPQSFLDAVATLSPSLLGLVREAARQAIAEAVDLFTPDVIFVMHAGILAELAIETGVPMVVHVAICDLNAAAHAEPLRDLVAASLGSAEIVIAADAPTADLLRHQWLTPEMEMDARDSNARDDFCIQVWPLDFESADAILKACMHSLNRR